MLRELRIRNVAVIEQAVLAPAGGFTVLTGETGAGKSILIDALQLVLGARSSEELLRAGSEEAEVEAAFDLPPGPVQEILAAEGIAAEAGEGLLLRRHLFRDGRSKAYVNGRLSTAGTLRSLAEHLVDIHGQQAGQPLLDPRRHRELLDAYAGLAEELPAYRRLYLDWQALAREQETLRAAERERAQRVDLLRFQQQEIEPARLLPDEEESLAAERAVLVNHERLFAAVDGAYSLLEESEEAVLDRLGSAATRLTEAAAIDSRLAECLETLQTGLVHLTEAARALRDYRGDLEFDPGRLDAIESRLHEIGRLRRKYGATVPEILTHLEGVRRELATLERSAGRLEELERGIAGLLGDLARRATALSAVRRQAAERLGAAVVEELRELGMGRAAFEVRVTSGGAGESTPGPYGADLVEFLISPNPGEALKPLHRIASGGELSRVMLAIRSVLAAADAIPTVVFDEIDAGIGGGMGDVVGRKLLQTSGRHQVLCVTHLPQIACFADQHLVVTKQMGRHRTDTTVAVLEEEARVEELARMLRGAERSAVVIQHARELLEGATRLKRRMKGAGGGRG